MSSDTQEMPSRRDDAARVDRASGPISEGVEAASGRSHVGRVRDDNQDRMYVGTSVFAVADGMGGRRAGAIAAETALGPVVDLEAALAPGLDDDVEVILRNAVVAANARVLSQAQGDPRWLGMGTTVTAMVIEGSRAHLAYVGDSRAYLFRDGALEQLTIDHTFVQHLVDADAIAPEEAAGHPQRAVITRGVGLGRRIDVDVAVTEIATDDVFVLCSDGLTSVVDDETITDVLRRHDDVAATADALVAQALEAGAPDNVTVVVVRIDGL